MIKVRDLVLKALEGLGQHVFKGRVLYQESGVLHVTPDYYTKKEFEQHYGSWPLALKEFKGFYFDDKLALVEVDKPTAKKN